MLLTTTFVRLVADYGAEEIDVVGLNLKGKTAYLCEVTTHIGGLSYGNNETTVKRIIKKHQRLKWYGAKFLGGFDCSYILWSPVVLVGYITDRLSRIADLELVIDGEYRRRIEKLRVRAGETTHDARNPFFRILQILEHMRDDRPGRSAMP